MLSGLTSRALLWLACGCLAGAAPAQAQELESIAVINPAVDASHLQGDARGLNPETVKLIKLRIEDVLKGSRRFNVYERDSAILEASALMEQNFAQSSRALSDAAAFGKMNNVTYIVAPIVTSLKLDRVIERGAAGGPFVSATSGEAVLTLKVIDTASGAIKYQKTATYAAQDRKTLTVMSPPDYGDVWLRLLQQTGTEAGLYIFDSIFPIQIVQLNGVEAILNRGDNGGLDLDAPLSLVSIGDALLDPKTGVSLGKVERKIGVCQLVSISERMSISKLALDASQTAKIGDVCRRSK